MRPASDPLPLSEGLAREGARSVPVFFAVSPAKLVMMWLCTFGWYQAWWTYMNWRAVRLQERSEIAPAARTVLSPLFAYALFRRMREAFARAGLRRGMPAAPLAAIWCLLTLVSWPIPLAGLGCLVVLVRLQSRVQALHALLDAPPPANSRLSVWNWIVVVVGALCWAMLLLALTAGSGRPRSY